MNEALKRRVVPSHFLRLDGSSELGVPSLQLRLSFDFNAIALIEERTGLFVIGGGDRSVWNHLNSARVLSVMLWATCLAHNPDLESDAGLEAIRSYMSPGNVQQISEALDEAFLISLPAARQAEIRATRKNKQVPKEIAADPGLA
ncbi:MAG TPA: hypothetical protein VFB23_00865 [Candidatus Acidoferrales bacterium]|nr:hypothetical protein [Candidatus Acidoferrales bacterium]